MDRTILPQWPPPVKPVPLTRICAACRGAGRLPFSGPGCRACKGEGVVGLPKAAALLADLSCGLPTLERFAARLLERADALRAQEREALEADHRTAADLLAVEGAVMRVVARALEGHFQPPAAARRNVPA